MAKKKNKVATRAQHTRKSRRSVASAPPDEPKVLIEPNPIDDAEEESLGAEFPVVGIGASAGGLEAFSEMLEHLPANTGMSFVLVQHLDPKHESMLRELLQRHTKMPVVEVTEGAPAEPNKVFVIPRDRHMTLTQGALKLSLRQSAASPHMPIDTFFRSLAEDQRTKSIGVILSGNASDGTLGMMAIKAAGGITFAQSSESARHDGMPRSAVAAGCIDFVLRPSEIATELKRLVRHPYIALTKPPSKAGLGQTPGESVLRILALLRTTTGTDFSFYKGSTIQRRIQRRMALRQMDSMDRYLAKLRSDPEEIQALFEDILINVTEFFRDPEIYDELKATVFPKIIPEDGHGEPVRIWVPGCSSGEEVYSLAIAFIEYMEARRLEAELQIFGTDLSQTALDKARAGLYTHTVVREISDDRLRRFFTKVDANYQITKRIREMCVFAKHNLVKDPPFSKLHMISCRNLLIYLGPVLQKRVMPILHFALQPNGFLLLGKSESIGAQSELFLSVDKQAKIYQRRPGSGHVALESAFEEVGLPRDAPGPRPADWSDAELQRSADRIVLGKYGPPGVVIDDDLNILQFRGRTSPYLEPSAGTASLNLLRMAREGLPQEIRNAVTTAQRSQAPVRREGLRIRRDSALVQVNFEVIPLRKGRAGRYLVMFDEPARKALAKSEKKASGKTSAAGLERESEQLRRELTSTKEYLQSIIEEQETSNEELRSANEEIQSSNEELQSTNEELETAKEELQSSNEELNTVNEELQNRNQQLSQSSNDLSNLLANVNIPIVMLGTDLRIRKFTPISEDLLNLIPSDIGRPISDINLNLDVPKLSSLLADVIQSLTPVAIDVKDLNGRLYSLRIRPYRTEDNRIEGVVMVLVDIDADRVNASNAADRAVAQQRSQDLNAFTAGLLISQERERQKLARELHDDFNQRLALLQVSVEKMERKAPSARDFAKEMSELRQQIGSLSNDLRRVAYRLHPAVLDELGLVIALEALVADHQNRYDIDASFAHSGVPDSVAPDMALVLYRVAQQALHNVAEHSRARKVTVTLTRTDRMLQLVVKDNGRGFNLEAARQKGRLGLISMAERMRMIAGRFEIRSESGTEVIAEVPFPKKFLIHK